MGEVTGSIPLLGTLEFLQIASFNHRDLHVFMETAGGAGNITLYDGEVIDANFLAQNGINALYAILASATSGTFRICPCPDSLPERTINLSLKAVLMRAVMMMPPLDPATTDESWTITGSSDIISVEELLQIYESSKRTALCDFFDSENATANVVIVDGGIVKAKKGAAEGVEVIYDLLAQELTDFRIISPARKPEYEKRLDIPSVVMEGLRRADEKKIISQEVSAEKNPHVEETLSRLESGELDEDARVSLAKRYLPGGEIAPASIVALLTVDESPRVRETAMATLHDLPGAVIEAFANDPDSPAPLLHYLLCKHGSETVANTAQANPSTPLRAHLAFVLKANAAQLRFYRENQELLKAQSALRNAVRMNPACDFADLLDKLDQEFSPRMRKRSFTEEPAEPVEAELVLETPAEDPKVEKAQQKLGPKDIQFLAKRGTLRQKMELVCGNEAEIAAEIVSQPGIPESFIQSVAEAPSANSAALRYIAGQRSFLRNTNTLNALIFNPKTPVSSATFLLTLVRTPVVMKVAGSRDVPDGTRQAARQLMEKRHKS